MYKLITINGCLIMGENLKTDNENVVGLKEPRLIQMREDPVTKQSQIRAGRMLGNPSFMEVSRLTAIVQDVKEPELVKIYMESKTGLVLPGNIVNLGGKMNS